MHSSPLCLQLDTQCLTDVSPTNDTHTQPNDMVSQNVSFKPLSWSVLPSKEHKKCLKKVLREVKKKIKQRHYQLCLRGLLPSKPMDMEKKKDILDALRNTVQPEQRTDEWYNQREEKITASSFGKIKTLASQRTLAFQKATQIRERETRKQRKPSGRACEWGVMFEDVCKQVYEHICKGAVVEEFGLLSHPDYPFIGASPDGICNEKSTDEYVGRLVEFKAPFSRPLKKDTVPEEYLAQIQGQLEVTQLDCCDYLECAFKTESRTEALLRQNANNKKHIQGFIIQPYTSIGQTNYIYSPLNDITDSTLTTCLTTHHYTLDQVHITYWYMYDYQKILVYRNHEWFANQLFPQLQTTFDMLTKFLQHDEMYQTEFEKRKQKKKSKVQKVECLFRNG